MFICALMVDLFILWSSEKFQGVLLWFSRLRIQHCYYCGSGRCCSSSLITVPGILHVIDEDKKKKKKKKTHHILQIELFTVYFLINKQVNLFKY